MKKILVTLFVLFSATSAFAQDDSFYSSTWKVKSLISVFKKDTIVFYAKDGGTNIIDYSKTEFSFSSDGTYSGKNNDGEESTGTCVFDLDKDTIIIDGTGFKLAVKDVDNFISTGYSMDIADAAGNLDTSYNHLTLYRVSIATGISNNVNSEEYINVFPNPTNHQLTIESVSTQTILKEIRITNMMGKEVYQINRINQSGTTIDTSNLPVGMYMVEIIDLSGNRITRKIAKQ